MYQLYLGGVFLPSHFQKSNTSLSSHPGSSNENAKPKRSKKKKKLCKATTARLSLSFWLPELWQLLICFVCAPPHRSPLWTLLHFLTMDEGRRFPFSRTHQHKQQDLAVAAACVRTVCQIEAQPSSRMCCLTVVFEHIPWTKRKKIKGIGKFSRQMSPPSASREQGMPDLCLKRSRIKDKNEETVDSQETELALRVSIFFFWNPLPYHFPADFQRYLFFFLYACVYACVCPCVCCASTNRASTKHTCHKRQDGPMGRCV